MKIEVLPFVKEEYLGLVRREAYWLMMIERLRREYPETMKFFEEQYFRVKKRRLELKEKVEGRIAH